MVVTVSAILTLGIAFAPAARAGEGYRLKLLKMVNAARDKRDLHTLRVDKSLTRDAMRHTRRMLAKNAIYDPRNLDKIMANEPWDDVGASVVGCASELRALHLAFMHHAAHREILLNPKLRRIGIGVVKVDSRNACGRHWFWATELFYG
jgi:uncharacterized protein YkwD